MDDVARLRVLLIDDDEDDFVLTQQLFKETGNHFSLDWAASYDAGLAALKDGAHDVCLLDYRLGAQSGLDLLRETREAGCGLPIILLTGQDSGHIDQDALAAGAADYLVKGKTTPDALRRALRHSVERHRVQEALRDRERVFRAVFDESLDAMLIADDSGRTVDANPAACALTLRSRDALLGQRLGDLLSADDGPLTDDAWRDFLRSGKMTSELLLRRSDGTKVTVDFRATANILPGRHLAVMRDVTERVQLDASRRRLATIVESTEDAVMGMTMDGRIEFWNGAAEAMYRIPRAEMLGKPISAVFAHHRDEDVAAALEHLAAGASARNHATVHRRSDGVEFEVSITLSPHRDADGRLTGGSAIIRDMTEQNRLRARVAISDRMASLGTLAAGVAHEINNPLAVVLANVELARMEPGAASGELGEMLADAAEAADRVKNIVRDLKLFTRADEDERRGRCNVRRVLDSTLRMVHNETRHRAQVVRAFDDVPDVRANESRLGQVFLNLLVNAAQSIPEGRVDQNQIRVSTAVVDGAVCVEITDTGSGIAADKLSRIFEPFFTTKEPGVGTGLGLSICHGIVASLDGDIQVTSTVGAGTTFRVRLPIASAADAERASTAARSIALGPRARVLVIDDDESVLRVAVRLLSSAHDVTVTSDPRAAVERLVSAPAFDVVLCDVMMPEMTGMDVYHAILAQAPEVARRFVFLTGGAFTPRARQFLDTVPNPKLEKPITRAELVAAVVSMARGDSPASQASARILDAP
jgi:PAS domain S-box-containing protein